MLPNAKLPKPNSELTAQRGRKSDCVAYLHHCDKWLKHFDSYLNDWLLPPAIHYCKNTSNNYCRYHGRLPSPDMPINDPGMFSPQRHTTRSACRCIATIPVAAPPAKRESSKLIKNSTHLSNRLHSRSCSTERSRNLHHSSECYLTPNCPSQILN